MAATDKFTVKDLIHKYGWDFMGYLANLGVDLPRSESQVIFVDTNATNASDADDAVHGHSFDQPVATLDYAIGLCTDGQGDVILIAPGHAESIASATGCVVDKSDLTIVGMGRGLNRPTFSLGTDAAAKISVTVANVTIKNIRVVAALANIAEGLDAEAAANGLWLEDCYFSDGNINNKELAIAVTLAAECDDVTIKNCEFHTVTGGTQTSAIMAVAGNDRLRIEGCTIYGDYSAACVDADATTAHLEICITDNTMINKHATGDCIKLYTGTTGSIVRNMLAHSSDTIDEAIDGDDAVFLFENYECDAVAKSAILIPATLCS